MTVVAAIAAMATITGEGRVADFSAGVQGLDIVPGHWHPSEFCRGKLKQACVHISIRINDWKILYC